MQNYLLGLLVLLSSAQLRAETQCIAHRGNSSEFLENSKASIRSALEMKAPAIEFDVHHTADHVAVLMHDGVLGRTTESVPGGRCPKGGSIAKLSFEFLRDNCQLKNGEEIPRLDEILHMFRGYQSLALIELKDRFPNDSKNIVENQMRGMEDQIRLISFDDTLLTRVRSLYQKTLLKEGAEIFHIAARAKDASTEFDGVLISRFSSKELAAFQAKKLTVGVWTINREKDMRSLARQGVDYVASDLPQLCMRTLDLDR